MGKSVKYRTLVRFVELKEEQEKAIKERAEKEKTSKEKTIKVNQSDSLIKTEIELEKKHANLLKKIWNIILDV